MTDLRKLVDRYISTWNETDPAARRKAVGELWTEDGTYTDPLADVAGHEAIDALIAGVQEQFPGWVFRAVGDVEGHHDLARFTWELGPAGGAAPIAGSDVVVIADDGRLRAVAGFLDRIPATA